MVTMRTVEYAYQDSLKEEEKLARKKAKEAEEESHTEVREFSMTRLRSPKLRLESFTVIQREEEVPRETIWWKKLFSLRKRKRQRRRDKMLCLWKDRAYVLGMP
jgi:hypothetical protein